MPDPTLEFFHNPHSRSAMTLALLEELGAEYETSLIDFRKQEQLSPDYLAVNPMGKVPCIRRDGVVVTETVAIFIYLADLYPAAGLAPALDDPDRGPYLRWLVFYAACFEPAIGDRAMQHEPAARAQSPYADFDTMLATLTDRIAAGPWILGDRFSAADVLWGNALRWVTGFGMIEATPVVTDYITRVTTRPAALRADQILQDQVAGMGLDGA